MIGQCPKRLAVVAIMIVMIASGKAVKGATVSFRNDVMAVFAKAGCNAGACHGNKNGKGGFKLSLRGQDPDLDFNVLTRELLARRLNPIEADRSLILLKATGQIPHEGGVRFRTDSREYQILLSWIQAGASYEDAHPRKLVRLDVTPRSQVLIAPESQVRITATAHFSDGAQRDVSDLAVYEQSAIDMAKVSPAGVVERTRAGETTVVVRYLDRQQPARLAFVPAGPDFQRSPTP